MKQQEFEQMKAMLEEFFIEKPIHKDIWFLLGFLTGNVGEGYVKERTYTETQLKELIELVSPKIADVRSDQDGNTEKSTGYAAGI